MVDVNIRGGLGNQVLEYLCALHDHKEIENINVGVGSTPLDWVKKVWINKVLGTVKTRTEAQALVDAEIDAQQTAWDNDNVADETAQEKIDRLGTRPEDITLEE